MRNEHLYLGAAVVLALAGLPGIAAAQSSTSQNAALADINTAEAPRVTQTINNKVVSPLQRSHVAAVDSVKPTQSVADSLLMNHMHLVLQRSALRQSALDALIAAQHDPSSPKFHQWVTPDQFGEKFGVSDADIVAATSWLQSQGFKVNGVYPNKMQIDFSGNAGLVKQAFHTQLNRYALGKTNHIANAADISVPTALKDVVVGVAGLNDIHPQSQRVESKVSQYDASTHKFIIKQPAGSKPATVNPEAIGFTNGARGLVPYDMAKIYGVDQLRNSGLTGTGITLAVVEDNSMVPDDWTNFVSQFSLGSFGGTFTQFQPQATGFTNCIDPTIANPGEDDGETLLDAEWSTAMAPGANIWVATCDDSNSNNFFGGVFTAATNLINAANRPNIISASYGYGEGYTDAASKTAIDLMWAQADAEGISVFVSSGDSGSNPSFNGFIINGVGIDANAFGTSPNDTVVGGTDTADVLDGTTKKYFASTYNSVYGSALSYVPEIPWNQSCGNEVAAKSLGFASALAFCKEYIKLDPNGYYLTSEAGSGGPSSVDSKPAWQRQVHNAAKDQSRDVPDVSLFAGSYGGDTWVIVCTSFYPCQPGFPGLIALSGGTSLSSPMFAGIQALIDQGLAAKGLSPNQGNAAPTLYALAADEYGGAKGTPPASLAACSADNGTKGTGKCVFHNITRGSIATQCIQQLPAVVTPDCYFYGNLPGSYLGPLQVGLTSTNINKYNSNTEAFATQAGWSFASGLGSVNANNLFNAWKAFVNVK
ncbi:S53 family peptidase [Dyella humicola]|uniref:S53 family peptidase n=1 Tax=Dyella humicola TaxID=2992126 RepID=UPI0022592FAA|nr:S53 family peptidase [Dyella humicola]